MTDCCYIVVCRDPLLGNDSETNNETKPAARKQIVNKQQLKATMEELLEKEFSMLSVPRL
jgi:hypothetical protein